MPYHSFQRRLLQNWHRMIGIPPCVVPASLWWGLELPPLAQFDAICVLSWCHKLIPSHQKRWSWTPSCCPSFLPVKLSKLENITNLEWIAFAQYYWPITSRHSRHWYSGFRQNVTLSCCRFRHFALESFNKEFLCLTRFASCHRDLFRVLVNEF